MPSWSDPLRRVVALAAITAALCGCVLGCADRPDVIIKTASGEEVTATDIDAEPLALLPAGPLGLVHTDLSVAFRSQMGQAVLRLVQARLPLPAEANFVPERDLEKVVVGLYAMAGVDFVGVAIGKFDVPAIENAAHSTSVTPLGTPLVKSEYTGRVLYTSGNIGFVPLTDRTALFGDETGMRRALDRVEAGIFRSEIAPATRDLFATPGAAAAGVFNVAGDPTVAAAAGTYPFLGQLHSVQVLGNFDAPGLNGVGTAVYSSEQAAAAGAQAIQQVGAAASVVGFLGSMLGMSQPLRQLEARPVGRNVEVAFSADTDTAGRLLNQLASALGATPVWSP